MLQSYTEKPCFEKQKTKQKFSTLSCEQQENISILAETNSNFKHMKPVFEMF